MLKTFIFNCKKLRKKALLAAVAVLLLIQPLSGQATVDVTLDELAEVMPELRQALDSVRLRKNPQLLNDVTISGKRLPKLALKNVSLKGATFKQCLLPELQLENVTLENFRFEGVRIAGASFKNVTFVNCEFDGSQLADSQLENCRFNGGVLRRNQYKDHGGAPDFNKNDYKNVVFDGVAFKNGFYTGNSSGDMSFKNIDNPDGSERHEGRYLAHGFGLELKIDGCNIGKISFFAVGNESKVTVKNSSFRGSDIVAGGDSQLTFEKCNFSGDTLLDVQGTVLLKDCIAKSGVEKRHGLVLDIRGGDFRNQ